MELQFFNVDTIRKIFSVHRLRAFIHTPLWLGVPIAAIAGFAVVWAICSASPAVDNPLKSGIIAAGCVAFAWVLGIWTSSGVDDDEAKNAAEKAVKNHEMSDSAVRNTIAAIGLIILFLGIIAIPDILRVVEDGRPTAIGIAGFTTKLLGIAAVIVPVWLRLRNR